MPIRRQISAGQVARSGLTCREAVRLFQPTGPRLGAVPAFRANGRDQLRGFAQRKPDRPIVVALEIRQECRGFAVETLGDETPGGSLRLRLGPRPRGVDLRISNALPPPAARPYAG